MVESDATGIPGRAAAPDEPVHDRAARLLAAAGAGVPQVRGGAVLALVEAGDPDTPPTVERAAGGCGGGRRILLTGRAAIRSDGVRPTHLVVRAAGPDGTGVLVLVERGDRGVAPWPQDGTTAGEVTFGAVRLDGDRVIGPTGRPAPPGT